MPSTFKMYLSPKGILLFMLPVLLAGSIYWSQTTSPEAFWTPILSAIVLVFLLFFATALFGIFVLNIVPVTAIGYFAYTCVNTALLYIALFIHKESVIIFGFFFTLFLYVSYYGLNRVREKDAKNFHS